jgi:hypothetical protein
VHGRTRLLALALGLACWMPSTAAAAPMPAGTYDVQLTNGTLDIGNGFLPPIPLSSGTSFTVPIGTVPVATPIGLTVVDVPISGSGITGTVSVTIVGAGATLDPSTGTATVDASFFASFNLSGSVGGFPVSGSCTIGSQNAPVNIHLSTADGSPWDAATNAFSMGDHAFALTPSCSPLIDALRPILLGTTNSGDNSAVLNGTAIRRPDPPPTTTTTTTQPGTTTTPGGSTPETTNNPVTPNATKCVVPKLVGKTLKAAKRALVNAHCKAGKAKSKKSKKKKGRVVAQGRKAGTRLPAGTAIKLTVSKGQKKARRSSSR